MDERMKSTGVWRNTTFGEQVRRLRRRHMEERRGGRARSEAWQVAAMAACLARHGYDISRRHYRSLEAGETLPDDPIAFLEALALCLSLSNDEGMTLLRQVSYDIVRARTDAGIADEVFG